MKDKKKKKEIYEKPELVSIDLLAEEVLSAGCKTSSAGPFPSCESGGCATQLGS